MIAFDIEKLNSRSQILHDQAVIAAKKYLVAEAELLTAIVRIDRDQTFKKMGYDHLTPYCVAELKLSEEVAGTFVRVARKGVEIPNLILAVEEGLHLTKAKVIASILTPQNQTEWISKARSLTKLKLEKEVAIANPLERRAEKAKPVGDNRNRVEFELNDEIMQLQRRAMELASQKLGRTASLAETQKYLLESFIRSEDPVVKADRASDRSRGRSLGKSRGERNTQAIPAAIKHQVFQRDRGCCQARTPDGSLCLSRRWIHLHHVLGKAQGGRDTFENLVTLCSSHHRLWHDMDGKDGGARLNLSLSHFAGFKASS